MTYGALPAGLSEDVPDLQLRSDRRLASTSLVLLAAPALWFARHDGALFTLDWTSVTPASILRVLLALILLAGVAAVSAARTREHYSRVIVLTALTLAACYSIGGIISGSQAPLRAPLLVVAVMYIGFPNTLWRQIVPPLLMSSMLLVTRGLPLSQPGDLTGSVIVFTVFNVLGCLAVARRSEMEGRVQQAWRHEQGARLTAERALSELDQLRGIIPICSHCRKVRNEVGGWQQIEQYVRDRSSANFSHGICPSCFSVHYSDAGVS